MIIDNIPSDFSDFLPQSSYTLHELIYSVMKQLEEQPDYTKLRVYLSYLYFKAGYYSFARRELLEIKKYTSSSLLDRILKSLGGLESETAAKIIAEIKM